MTATEPPGGRERIEAASFQVASIPDPAGNAAPWRLPLMAGAAVFLGLLVMVVVLLLPKWVASPDAPPEIVRHGADNIDPTPAAADTAVAADAAAVDADDTPGATATTNRAAASDPAARTDSQALLRETLDKLEVLEKLEADSWAKTDLHAIRTRIAEGEKAYREKRYVTAQNIYLDTSAAVERLLAGIPDLVTALIESGQLALDNGDSAAAQAAFEQALLMAPNNQDAARGLARAGTLDQVTALVGEAEGYERLGDNTQALKAYREALRIDKSAPGAAAAVQRIERGQRDNAYRAAMSRGFEALAANRFAQARKAFEEAAAFDATRTEPAAALAQVANAETSARVGAALAKARTAVEGERWSDAESAYQQALKHDQRLSEARSGAAQAKRRAALDQALELHLRDPARLADAAVLDEARRILGEARKVSAPGPKLTRQIARLERATTLARTPLDVSLRSDGATLVTVYRVGELGQFESRALSLLPGRYVAVGRRDGYRDVRVEFVLDHDRERTPVVVQCVERIASGR